MWTRAALILAVTMTLAGAAWAQAPVGNEFQVNTTTNGHQTSSSRSIAMAPDGTFVVVWKNQNPMAGYGQRFDALGTPLGSEFQVNTSPATYFQDAPIVAADGRGEFVVAWSETASYYGPSQVLARRYDAAGVPRGGEVQVNVDVTHPVYAPDIAADRSGNFILLWTDGVSYDIVGRRYDPSGLPVGGEFQVNTYTPGLQYGPSVDYDANGNFIVAWESSGGQDGDRYGVFARRFDAAGLPLGPEFAVNAYTTGSQLSPRVAVDASGAFLIAWTGAGAGTERGVFARRFDASGAARGADFRVDTSDGFRWRPLVASDAAGNTSVTWTASSGSVTDVMGRRYAASGAARGGEFRINAYTPLGQFNGSVAMDSAGNFVVAWGSDRQDGSGYGVFAQRFAGLFPAALVVDGGGNGVLEPNEVAAIVAPAWGSTGALTIPALAGVVAGFTGPPGATYAIDDDTASYGALAAGATASCTATGNCYALSVTGAVRPAVHWDTRLTETLTPIGVARDWTLHVGGSFFDVPASSGFYPFVESILHEDVTGGCAPGRYCPSAPTAREQMAVFVLEASQPAGYAPPACGTVPRFTDVPASNPFCPWIEDLQRRRITDGCGGGNYCPASPATREQMAVFVLRTLDASIDPPACGPTPVFADVPVSSPFCRWIEELARRGVATGCGGGNYCPTAAVTREQMAVFLTVTFGLALYGS